MIRRVNEVQAHRLSMMLQNGQGRCLTSLTPRVYCRRSARQRAIWCAGEDQQGHQAAAEAAGLLRAVRHRVSIADMAAGLSAATGGERPPTHPAPRPRLDQTPTGRLRLAQWHLPDWDKQLPFKTPSVQPGVFRQQHQTIMQHHTN